MIVYKKLEKLLQERNMVWKDLRKAGLSQNMPTKFSKNENVNSDIINRICEYFKVQPSEIMEWIPDAEYSKVSAEKKAIETEIARLKEKLKNM